MKITAQEAYHALKDPFVFIEKIWKLTPQKVLPEYEQQLYECRRTGNYEAMKLSMFEPCIKGKHITWQQAEIVRAVNYARLGVKSAKISVASGHGIGKSTIMAMLILWYLFVFYKSKIGCTAPNKHQMYDVLWAEIRGWLDRMPDFVKRRYEYTSDYLRMLESPESWFARARTARKETPEALAGLHADYLMVLADEASGVEEEIFQSAKSALTNENTIFLMISNPTRLEGYFYRSHHELKGGFQTLSFSSIESPVVSEKFVEEIISENGEDSDQYRIRVLGKFPRADEVDTAGYIPLYNFEVLTTRDNRFVGDMVMAIDPAGMGGDEAVILIRDQHKAWVIQAQKRSTPKGLANLVATILLTYQCKYVVYDNFGVGANLGVELANMGIRSIGVNVGETQGVDKQYENMRAELFWRSREWLREGGEVDPSISEELGKIKYKNTMRNKVKIMGKDEMRKRGIPSPNRADAFMLSFYPYFKPKMQFREKMQSPLSSSEREKRGKIY